MAFDATGKYIAIGCTDSKLRVVNTAKWAVEFEVELGRGPVRELQATGGFHGWH